MSRLTVTTPWYPTPFNRMAGSFVAQHARLAAGVVGTGPDGGVRVVHGLEWPGGTVEASQQLRPAFDDVLDAVRAAGTQRLTGAAGPLDRVPVFTVGGTTWAQRAEALVRDVRRGAPPVDSPLVHGHVGYLGGLLAARLADPAATVFATEHSTALRDVLADAGSRDHYAELLSRATKVFCVSGLLRDQVLEQVPDPDGTLTVLPNPVDFASVPRRAARPEALRRWVFVGGLHARKGVERLVRAFAVAAREDADVTLTMIGDGALRGALEDLAREAGVADRLHLPGVLRHPEVLARLPEFDLLLAPSTYETFHLAVVEAVAAGVPVIVTRSGGPQEALAGVEDRVGRFVDVEDSPDQLVDAWRELSKSLESLDLDGARADLDARYGLAASAARLAAEYGLTVAGPEVAGPARTTAHTVAAQSVPALRAPERIALLATTGWRRYSVETELAAARTLGVDTTVVATDPQILGWAQGLPVVAPKGVELTPAAAATVAAQPLSTQARRFAGRLKRRLLGGPGGAPAAAPPPRGATLGAGFLGGATVLVTDCQSMPLARAVLEVHPGAVPAFELDRVGALGPTPDAEDA